MAFIDELSVHIKAGKGGDGVVRWLREKFKPKGGPAGGDGGDGGDVYIRAVRDLSILQGYTHTKEFAAEDGGDGGKKSLHGKNGEDLVIDLPMGAKVSNQTTGEVFQLVRDGETVRILQGGTGGLGNEQFKSSVNRTPQEWTPGTKGEEADFEIELELIADVGLVGLPSAGKSTLLNELTNAHSKVGAYHFTTLEPHLGAYHGYIIADIPGLIEGASTGRGLGHTFLRHIKKTALVVHCISFENEDVVEAYRTIRNELDKYDQSLADKPECIVLTKKDLVDDEMVASARTELGKFNSDVLAVSIIDEQSIKDLGDAIVRRVRGSEQVERNHPDALQGESEEANAADAE
ncbi:MAG: GTPase ObgE [Candidatus Paceibacterota bacterium]